MTAAVPLRLSDQPGGNLGRSQRFCRSGPHDAAQNGRRIMVDASQITEHMEVVGSDGQHVGTVDNLVIKLTKKDPAAHGQHHLLKLATVESVEGGKLKLNIPAAEAMQQEQPVG